MKTADMKKIISIYQIRNLVNGKLYIGSSLWTQKRFNKHSSLLSKGTHPNAHLQAAWNLYGKVAFAFEILEVCPPDTLEIDLRQKEAGYIKTLAAEYNMAVSTTAPMTGRKHSTQVVEGIRERMKLFRHTEESKKKIADSNRRRKGETRSAAVRAKLSAIHKGKKHKPFSDEARKNISEAQKRRFQTQAPTGCAARGKGWKHTEEARRLMKRV
jgi:group I intron endonuclease